MGIRLAGEVEGVEVSDGAAGQHALELRPELISPHGQGGEEALLLAQGQLIHHDFGSGQLHGNVLLELLQSSKAFCLQLHENSAVQKRSRVSVLIHQQLEHVTEVALRLNGFRHVISGGHEFVAPGSVLHDLVLLSGVHQPVVHPERHAGAVRQPGQDRLGLSGGRVFPDHPDAAIAVAQNIVIRHELDDPRGDHVKEFLGAEDFRLLRGHDLGFAFHESSSSRSRYCSPSPSGMASPFMLASK